MAAQTSGLQSLECWRKGRSERSNCAWYCSCVNLRKKHSHSSAGLVTACFVCELFPLCIVQDVFSFHYHCRRPSIIIIIIFIFNTTLSPFSSTSFVITVNTTITTTTISSIRCNNTLSSTFSSERLV